MFRGWRWKVKSTYIYIWMVYIYIYRWTCTMSHLRRKVWCQKRKTQPSPSLQLYSTMVDPARTLGRRVAELARDWNGEKMDQLHGTKEFCRNVCLLMGLNAMLGSIYIYIWKNSIKNAPCKNNIYIYNCEKSFCNSPKMPIRIFANFESPFRTIADFSAIGFLCV